MCDYSLQHVKSQPAQVADKLITKNFGTGTIGFTLQGAGEPVAVCLLPGTEVAFDNDITVASFGYSLSWLNERNTGHRTARFRQLEKDKPYAHHDALELPDGEVVLLSHLVIHQTATVLQLPAQPKTEAEAEEQKRAEYAG